MNLLRLDALLKTLGIKTFLTPNSIEALDDCSALLLQKNSDSWSIFSIETERTNNPTKELLEENLDERSGWVRFYLRLLANNYFNRFINQPNGFFFKERVTNSELIEELNRIGVKEAFYDLNSKKDHTDHCYFWIEHLQTNLAKLHFAGKDNQTLSQTIVTDLDSIYLTLYRRIYMLVLLSKHREALALVGFDLPLTEMDLDLFIK